MKTITPENINKFCRTCIKELNVNKVSLTDNENIAEIITFCTSTSIETEAKLPEYVCRKCYKKLQSFYDFRCLSMQSVCKLYNIIKKLKEEPLFEVNNDIQDSCRDNEKKINQTKSQEKMQNYSENTKDPIAYTLPQVGKGKSEVKVHEEADEVEIHLNDLKIRCEDYVEELNSLETVENVINVEIVQKTNNDFSDIPAILSKKRKGKRTLGMTNKNPKRSNQIILSETKKKSSITARAKFKCEKCLRRFVSLENYQAHLRTHQGLKPFACQECCRSFNKANSFRAHMREVHAPVEPQYSCSYEGCGKVFKRKGSYDVHYRLKHKYSNQIREPKKWMCEECGSTFKDGTKFKEHRYKHLPVEQYPFKCDECGKRYRSKCKFKEHQYRHSGIKKYVCSFCGMKKPTQHELRTHINYHTKEKQWPCSKCKSVFSNAANLRRHDRVVHQGIRQYACSYCDESFGKQETLKHHEMRHTGEKPHSCNICGKRFIQAVALRTHLRVHNKRSVQRTNKLPINEKVNIQVEKMEDFKAESLIEPNVSSGNDINTSR